jgi:predicted solute-binding protein
VPERIHLINIRYLNSIPYRVFSRIPSFDYQEGLPAECATALLHGEVDIALLPIASIIKHGFYELLPYGIVAREESKSVFLFSNCPLSELKEILLDSSSETSVLLLKTLLAEFFPDLYARLRFRVEEPERIITGISGEIGGLVIGDLALAHSGHFTEVLDLSGEWHRQTSYPFVFAAWAYRPGSLTDAQLVSFMEAVRGGLSEREHFARDWADTLGISRDGAARYVTESISYELTPHVQDGARLFCKLAARHNLLPDAVGLGSFNYYGESGTPPPVEKIVDQALGLKRLSVNSALRIVSELSLVELSLLGSRLKALRPASSSLVYRMPLVKSKETGNSLVAPTELEEVASRLQPQDALILETRHECDELTLEGIRLLVSGLPPRRLFCFTPPQLEKLGAFDHLSVEELVGQLVDLGFSGAIANLPLLFSEYGFREIFSQLGLLRKIAHFGMNLMTMQPVENKTSLDALAVHLFHIRQLQDQTERVSLHLIESTDESVTPSVEHLFRSVILAQLILDNVQEIAVSPLVFGAPTVEVLLEMGAPKGVVEL